MNLRIQINRRTWLKTTALAAVASACGVTRSQSVKLNDALPLWSEGYFDIHQIDTGRGNSTLLIFPDGTTMMIDAGAGNASEETSSKAHPNTRFRPGQWQALYAGGYSGAKSLDYFLTTHIHPDHIGDITGDSPLSADGTYRLTGVSDVDAMLPITTLIDRAYPEYGSTPPLQAAFAKNYLAYLKSRSNAGRSVQRAEIGSDRQVVLRKNPSRFPAFKARVLSANGEVWKTPARKLSAANENLYSVAMRFEYGRFSYFTGGDLSFDTNDNAHPEMDIETPVVHAAGRTEVALADHHAYFDACGPEFVKALDAQAYIIPGWDIGHPGSAQIQRLTGNWSGKATHDVFATDVLPANALLNRRFVPQMKAAHGHIVVRVDPGGATYNIHVIDSNVPDGKVIASFGPYSSRA